MDNEKLVFYVYSKLAPTDFVINNKDDLIQEGYIGLLKAERSYNPAKGVKFSTYATMCIRNAMLLYMRQIKKDKRNTSLNSILDEENQFELVDVLSEDSNFENKIMVDFIFNSEELDEKEQIVLKRLYDGYTQIEIKKEFKVGHRFFKRLFDKLKVIINDFTN